MKYKVGDKVKIKSLDWYNENKSKTGFIAFDYANFIPEMSRYCDEILTINQVVEEYKQYLVSECPFSWTDEMIEGLVEEDLIPKFGEYSDNEPLDIPTMTTEFVKEHGLPCPEGYQFKDENGNVINATKIVLEKKKNEYPKTYEECCKVLGFENTGLVFEDDYRDINPSIEQWKRLGLLNQFNKLLICRDVYWKIAGEEMGLDGPWELSIGIPIYYIYYNRTLGTIKKDYADDIQGNVILAFPTEEIRDAFYESFKKEIEKCKELL